jgi:putative FmdB family regulatory protein
LPTYSYKCTECATAFDIQQAFTDDSLTVCPNCGGKLRKVFSAIGVTFNGSGFYRTDSRPEGKKADAGGSSSESKSGESKSGESKSGDTKSGDTASSASRSGDSGSGSSSSQSESKSSKTPAASPTKAAG